MKVLDVKVGFLWRGPKWEPGYSYAHVPSEWYLLQYYLHEKEGYTGKKRSSTEVGKSGELAWDSYCSARGIPNNAIPVAKRYGERRPDRKILVGGQDVTVEVKAIHLNPDWDKVLNSRGGTLLQKLAGETPESKRVWLQTAKSSSQHTCFAEAVGISYPSLTVLVEERPLAERDDSLVSIAKRMLVLAEWKTEYLPGISAVGVLVDCVLTVIDNPHASTPDIGQLALQELA